MAKRVFIGIALLAFVVCALALAQGKKAVDHTKTGVARVKRAQSEVVKKGKDGEVIPWHINYQGYLTDIAGNPINGNVSMVFTIWTSSSGGSQLWREGQTVGVKSGLFNVVLGASARLPLSVFEPAESRWLQLAVEGQTLSPRTKIISVRLEGDVAFSAPYADRADTGSYVPLDERQICNWDLLNRYLHPHEDWGLSMRKTNRLYGNHDSTHVCLGVGTTTGTSGSHYKYCTVSGGFENAATTGYATVGGGFRNVASEAFATVGGGYNSEASGPAATVGGGSQNHASDTCATVAGGESNNATNWFTTVGGGSQNTASGYAATVAGGGSNTASDSFATVSGGFRNTANDSFATVAGGDTNVASGPWATVSGGCDNTASGWAATVPGGYRNVASGQRSFAAGCQAKANHLGSFVWADAQFADFASTDNNQFLVRASGGVGIGTASPTDELDVAGTVKMLGFKMPTNPSLGYVLTSDASGEGTWQPAVADGDWIISGNDMYSGVSGNVGIGTATPTHKLEVVGDLRVTGKANIGPGCTNPGDYAFVAGMDNAADGAYATIAGGYKNAASSAYATVGGGILNTASGSHATAAGGDSCTASGVGATVGGGAYNTAGGQSATVAGGARNTASGNLAAVSGGYLNTASGQDATVSGGGWNTASGYCAAVGGGTQNSASGAYGTVGGGTRNTASGNLAAVSGGYADTVIAPYGGVSSGWHNIAGDGSADTAAFVGGGRDNCAIARYATVAGGYKNTASDRFTTVAGGDTNVASGPWATVSGGCDNTASGWAATVPGGYRNVASGQRSFAAGCQAKANHLGSFVWADAQFADFASTDNNQFLVRASGGVGIGTASPTDELDVAGTVKMLGFKMPTNPSLGYVLTSDASGEGTWQPAVADGDWIISGNDMYSGISGNVGIGTASPTHKLEVVGDLRVTGKANIGPGCTNPGDCAFVAGRDNAADGAGAAIGGGSRNVASGDYASVGGGSENVASGIAATVPGGQGNVAAAGHSLAAGRSVNVDADAYCTFAFGRDFTTWVSNAVIFHNSVTPIRVGIGTTSPANILTVQRNSVTDPIADAWTIYSSKRWKTNIEPIPEALEKVKRLRGVYFDWKESGEHDIGLIAEEVGEVIPELVAYEDNGEEARSLDYARLVAVLIEAVKEQQTEIESLREEVQALKGR